MSGVSGVSARMSQGRYEETAYVEFKLYAGFDTSLKTFHLTY